MRFFRRWLTAWRESGQIETLFAHREPEPKLKSTANLYVLKVDFPVAENEALATAIDKNLQRFRDEYGIDFFVLEPGIKLSRFDDI